MTYSNSESNIIRFNQLSLQDNKLILTLFQFKYSSGKPKVIVVNRQAAGFCPVEAMSQYLVDRSKTYLFLLARGDGTYIKRQLFAKVLSRCFLFIGLDFRVYKSHSFRIGAATHAALHGKSDAYIRSIGRWNSDAFKQYIRV